MKLLLTTGDFLGNATVDFVIGVESCEAIVGAGFLGAGARDSSSSSSNPVFRNAVFFVLAVLGLDTTVFFFSTLEVTGAED
jgi:hypothetical protein